MRGCCTSTAKKAFCPPFKATAAATKSKQIEKAENVQRRIVVSAQLPEDAAHPPSDEDISQSDAALGVHRQPAEPACVTMTRDETSLTSPFHSSAEPPNSNFACQLAGRSRGANQRSVKEATATTKQQLALLSSETERSAMVGDTLYWIGVSQKAVQYLADALTNGDVERVLAELHIDAQSVLYSIDEGDFLQP